MVSFRATAAATTLLTLCGGPPGPTTILTSHAQERPTLTLPLFDYNVSHRSSVCDRQSRLDNGTLQLRDAVAGMDLNVWLAADGRYFRLDEDGAVDASDPGLIGVLMDQLAARAGFSWRNSFGITDSVVIEEGRTYNELLSWSVWAYDMSAAYWTKSIRRMDLGVSFPEGWYDGRLVMIGVQDDGGANLDIWSFLEPFSMEVWIMIIVTIVVSALVYWFLDWFDARSDAMHLGKDPAHNLFLSALSFAGHFEFQPTTNAARLFTVSLAFWSLIMMSAYTANLASFLVVNNAPSIEINTVGDVVRNNLPICVIGSTYADTALSVAYPGARIVRTKTEEQTYFGVNDGTCRVALISHSSWEENRGNRTINGDCQLKWIGRSFRGGEGGFATKSDSGTLCTSLVRDVINLHLEEMKDDGSLERAWEDYLSKKATVDCSSELESSEGDDESGQLSLKAMGGTFIVHYAVTAIAILLSVFWKCHEQRTCACRRKNGPGAATESNRGSVFSEGGPNYEVTNEAGTQNGEKQLCEDVLEKHNERLAAMLMMMENMKRESDAMRELLKSEDTLKY